jgi:CubicO group peptidase (beta-lactamase class C family)
MYTGAGIMQLKDRGVLKLDDLASTHVDPILKRLNGSNLVGLFGHNASAVTIDHLMGMQSGIYDFDDDYTRAFCNFHPKIDVTPFDDIHFASQRGNKTSLYFPGTDQDYSSTNFELLGLILAHYANASNWDTYNQRGVFPAAIQSQFPKTKFALHGPCANFTSVHGYEPDDSYGYNLDTYFMSCTNGYTCGNIATTAEEVNDYVWNLYGPPKAVVSADSVGKFLVQKVA